MNLVKNLDDFIKDFTEYKIKMTDRLNNLEIENNQLKDRITIIENKNNKLKRIVKDNIVNGGCGSGSGDNKQNNIKSKNNNYTSSSLKRNRSQNNKIDLVESKKNKIDFENNIYDIQTINKTRKDKSYSCWCNPNSNSNTTIVSSPPKAI